MCLSPIYMYDTGRKTSNGKRLLSARWSDYYLGSSPIPVPCGKCPACLERKRNEWCKRMLLESCLHDYNSFFTLTYDDSHLPKDGLASKRDIQLFLKRFRHAPRDYGVLEFDDFKYFIVSEYGKLHHRPHYHGLFFGVDLLHPSWKNSMVGFDGRFAQIQSSVLASIWDNGYVLCDRLSSSTVRYVAKYITKQDSSTWSLKSIGLARSLFVHSSGLTDLCRSSVLNGKISYPSRRGFYDAQLPRFIDRYLERYDPSLLSFVKSRRKDYVHNMPSRDLAALRDGINYKSAVENKKRKLDNET